MQFPLAQERANLTAYELSPEVKARIAALQARLDEAGCVGLHINWNREALASGKLSLDDAANAACAGLEALLNGDVTEMESFDDGTDFLSQVEPAPALDDKLQATLAGVTFH